MGLRNTSVEFGALAKTLHWLGAMTVATGGKGLPFFGWFSIPLPVLAALYNHFVARNGVLRRMTVGVN